YEYTTMPFGLIGASQSFERMMDIVLAGLPNRRLGVYIDDVLIASETPPEEHFQDIQNVFQRLREHGLKVKLKKCMFAASSVIYLGHRISKEGIQPNDKKVKAVKEMRSPENVSEVRSVLGLFGFFRRFIKGFTQIARPILRLLKKTNAFIWGELQEASFQELKLALIQAPILMYPDYNAPYVISTDASYQGVGASLEQLDKDGVLRPVAYASRCLNDPETRYGVTQIEMLAVVYAFYQFRQYVQTQTTLVYTDHTALVGLFSGKSPCARVNRWIMLLMPFRFAIRYRGGPHNKVADALSRLPVDEAPKVDKLEVNIQDRNNADITDPEFWETRLGHTMPKKLQILPLTEAQL
ncbi:MAG: hypothetical protein GY696_04070, partial [Gammaproteobacteria bacterium]|nr:hypothetical protein [Gammaproteobacteria bacterium]